MTYTARILDHFHNPRNCGVLEDPSAEGVAGTPGQGNYMIIEILVVNGRVARALFRTYGCPGAIACGSAATVLAEGKGLVEVAAITRDDIDAYLGGMPLGKGHCADLAAAALADAVAKASGR